MIGREDNNTINRIIITVFKRRLGGSEIYRIL